MGRFNMPGVPGFGGGGVYTDEGTYKVQIENFFQKVSLNPEKKGDVLVICEWKFVESSNEKHKPGTSGSWAATIQPDPYGYTTNDVIRLVYSAVKSKGLAAPDEQLFELAKTLATAIAEPDQKERAEAEAALTALGIPDAALWLKGCVVALEVKKVQKKRSEGQFSRHYWS